VSDTPSLSFTYATHDVRVVFGAGVLATLPAELERRGMRRVVLITTPGRPADREAVAALLGERLAGQCAGAMPHVPHEVVREAHPVVVRARPDALLALGGGSAIGLCKALALETGLPLAAIPTTYSGSEMTSVWGISDGQAKRTGRDPRVAPRLVIYDPELTYGLPPEVSAASGMNAIAHCVEAAYAHDAGPVSSLFASDGLRRLAESLPVIMASPRDPDARADALAGAHLAGRALDLTSMGLHHKLAHVLGGSFGLPHAGTHAALLPWVTAYNAPAAGAAMARIAAALRADDAVEGLLALARTLKTPTLADLGFTADMIPRAAALAAASSYPNPRPVDEPGVRSILACALAGRRL
jgi:maleylacetate reductase